MERKIGEIWESNGCYYKCVPWENEEHSCQGCVSLECGSEHCGEWNGGCKKRNRADGKDVIFKRLKEVWKNVYFGEPKWCDDRVFETEEDAREAGMTHRDRYITSKNIADKYGYVERINNKDDMKESKLNLKPFDIEAAKAGKPVCTRDGRKARIICFDAKCKQPIIALFEREKADEVIIQTYNEDGSYYGLGKEDNRDLMMLPEKKEGWINVYALNTCYSSKEEAEANIDRDYEHEYVRTVKIEWEE